MSTNLFEAIDRHDLDRLAELLASGADPNEKTSVPVYSIYTPLMAAVGAFADGCPIDAIVLLLRHGASVNGLGFPYEASPLLVAVRLRLPEAARILLAAGADTNVCDDEGDSPLRVSVEHGDLVMAELLLRCGATGTIDEGGGVTSMTALGRAASDLNLPMIELLLKAGADPDAEDSDYKRSF